MESDLQQQFHFFHGHYQPQQHHQKQTNTGLTRYQSAPSAYFSSLLDKDFCEDFLSRPSSPETAKILAGLLANSGGNTGHHPDVKQEYPVKDCATQVDHKAQIMASTNNCTDNNTRLHRQQQQNSNYSVSSQSFYRSQSKPPLPDHSSGSGKDYRAMTSNGMEILPQMKTGGGNNSNLVRHSSSPAGLFAKINIEFENGYAVMKSDGDFGDTAYSASNRPASGGISAIAEMGKKHMAQNSKNQGGLGEARNNDYVTGYRMGYWEDSSRMMAADTKGLTDEDRTLSGIDESETQDVVETGSPSPVLAHHLSLPNTTAEISAIENFLHLQDSVPCKIRAKRGCATHPRSIAERVRRTRISERMRKLQDLVPNMDKQTNTSDMLDLAVDYIKDLQREVKTLSESRAKCRCTDKQLPWQ